MRQPETRASLIVKLKDARDEPAWNEFVRTYEPFLEELVQRHVASEWDRADIRQQIWLAIARSVEGWRDDGRPASFRRWLNRVARNAAIKFLLREKRQPKGKGGSGFAQLEGAPDISDDDQRSRQYEHEMILWAAEQVRGEFQESSWRSFWMTQIDGRCVAETAAELGLSPGAIYMSKSRILKRIRAKIEELDAA